MLISLLILLLFANALILRKDKSILFTSLFVPLIIGIFFKMPLILEIKMLSLNWLIPIVSGFSACLVYFMRIFLLEYHYSKYNKYILLYIFFLSVSISSILLILVDLYLHFKDIYLFLQLFSFIFGVISIENGFINLFSTGSDQNNGGSIESDTAIRNNLSSQLANLTYTINFQLTNLNSLNLRFENYFEKAHYYRGIGDVGNETSYTELARTERINIRNLLIPLQENINRRDALATHAQSLFSRSRFQSFSDMSIQQQESLRIAAVLSNSERWNI